MMKVKRRDQEAVGRVVEHERHRHPAREGDRSVPRGRPPRSGVPRPVYALTAMTMMTVTASATSVSSAGASREPVEEPRAPVGDLAREDEVPDGDGVQRRDSTAPAAMSFASFAIGSNDVDATSTAASIAVFTSSATSTNVIASRAASARSCETPNADRGDEDGRRRS